MIKSSQWEYETAGSAAASIGDLLLSGGKFILKDPAHKLHAFEYAGFGAGVGLSTRMPKSLRLPDIRLPRKGTVSGSGATTDFQGRGFVYRFREPELKPEDFAGMTIYVDASAGLLVTENISGFIAGIDQRAMIPWMFNPGLFASALGASAKAFVLLRGMGEGLVDAIGGGVMLGSINYKGPYTE
ncbi:hypothetical protein BTHE68_50150 [Burkholderia sp. THE68]|uniref:hypothetical protein n=1 Tax=Burkholderiaceae TaxID=119060 RepID=UPI0013167854|nr:MULTISPECIES: hypothetical protein [Burkholderiaceae]BBU31281.1 hypothetical protein BTHE68_50150 [Burkholderia sp. THE68]BCQ26398.1 hypothetical protein NK8_45820 [Caballeronia sp. NK8]